MKLARGFWIIIFVLAAFFTADSPVAAFYNNMPADMVIGQGDLFSAATGASSTRLGPTLRGVFIDPKGHLIVSEFNNNRILIWNSVPTVPDTPADIVLGQDDFSGITGNHVGFRAANTVSLPGNSWSDGERLILADQNNGRVLIWNTFPTTNGQSADVVIGKNSMTDSTYACDSRHFTNPYGVSVNQGKLAVVDRTDNRVLIFNSIPTSNMAAADVVVGQANFTTCSAQSISDKSLSDPRTVQIDPQGRMFVADRGRQRILLWNHLPTTNNAPADVVIGQLNFTSSGGVVAQNRIGSLVSFHTDGKRLFVGDIGRTIIYNSIPTSNGAYADVVLGQSTWTSNTAYAGGTVATNGQRGIGSGLFSYFYKDKYYLADETSSRIMVFSNVTAPPGISIDQNPQTTTDNQLKYTGSVNALSPYTVKSVQYSVNNAGWQNATAVDGSFDTSSEQFVFQFDPSTNPAKDENGKNIDGYTIQLRSTNSNGDLNDHTLLFTPFTLQSPADQEVSKEVYPWFSFSVNQQKNILAENLDHYAVQVRDRSSTTGWTTLVDQIPVDFARHKGDLENLQHSTWESISSSDGEYETANFIAKYSDQGSKITVRSKTTALSGSYEWKVVAIDKSGHSQETGSRNLVVAGAAGSVTPGFPLAILNISGLGNPGISSYNLAGIKPSYRTNSNGPTFYGIAWSGATVKATFTEQKCSSNCTVTLTTTANALSRFGINVPNGTLKQGKSYLATVSVQMGELFTSLPPFTLMTGRN